MTIISANMVIVVTVFLEKSLHQPMYIFICCLSVNSLYGSTGFFSRFLFDLLSDTHFISRPACFTKIFVICTFELCEFPILGVMAYDRFVAICQPLHYHTKMSRRKVCCLWAAAVVYPAVVVCFGAASLSQNSLCGYKLPKILCGIKPIVDISCEDLFKSDIVGLVFFPTLFVPLFFVPYSYVRILVVCRGGTAEVRGKPCRPAAHI